MCRIVGICFKNKYFDAIRRMTDSLAHGGPDDQGIWQDDAAALGHRRLSIIDLSSQGHQPMLSASGRYVIVFNGEVYNFKSLRKILEQIGYSFKSDSDTEVILSGIEAWGFTATLEKMNGMFAIAVWDRQDKKLYLARDRFGEKPLYYGIIQGAFVFASELKAICLYPEFTKRINIESVQLLLRYAYIQAPHSIYEQVFKLEPGHFLVVNDQLIVQKKCYWSAIDVALQAKKQGSSLSFQQAVDALEIRLMQSVQSRCISDVPLGAFLSGGVDSSVITALIQKFSDKPAQTFSIGFEQTEYNEAPFAKRVAEHLGCEHHELYVTDQDALNVIPKLATIYDEPFADSSQIPTYLVSQFAKTKVSVVLSGDAGDELFGGYQRYFLYSQLERLYALPFFVKNILSTCLRFTPHALVGQRNALRLEKLRQLLGHSGKNTFLYDTLISQNHRAEQFLYGVTPQFMSSFETEPNILKPVEQVMLKDSVSYLPGDILTKVDRASMAVALEVRVPFLDHELFEFLWTLPFQYKVHKGQGKILLKELLYRYVPKELVDRPKAGFGIPIHEWLRGPLKGWAYDLIADSKKLGILNQPVLEKAFQDHVAGRANLGYLLWNALMFQSWMEQF